MKLTASSTRLPWLAGIVLVVLVAMAYSRVAYFGYIWDDDFYVTENPHLLDAAGLQRIWLDPGATPQYYPVVFTTFWLEHHLWGLHPAGYHVVNVLLHAGAALLWWRLLMLLGLDIGAAWLAAAWWALHPVQVESVAWITERKNVLSALFYLATALALARCWFGNAGARGYAAASLLFLLAMGSKTTAATLPAAWLLVLWWKLGRLRWRDAGALLPFLAVAVAGGLLTATIEKLHVGAEGLAWDHTLVQRWLIAGRALCFYAGKLLWPTDLLFTYPRWHIDAGDWRPHLYPLGASAALITLLLVRKRLGRGPAAGALFFAGTLTPALGFFDVFPMVYSYVADHFQYMASMGLIVVAAAGVWRVRPALLSTLGAAAVTLVLASLSWSQTGIYRDARTLWLDTVQRNPGAWMAHNNLGLIFLQEGDRTAARQRFEESLKAQPGYAEAENNLGNLALEAGDLVEAQRRYQQALASRPRFYRARHNLGVVHLQARRWSEAMAAFAEALTIKPDAVASWYALAEAQQSAGDLNSSATSLERAAVLEPTNVDVLLRLGHVRDRLGDRQGAVACYREVLRLAPGTEAARQARRRL